MTLKPSWRPSELMSPFSARLVSVAATAAGVAGIALADGPSGPLDRAVVLAFLLAAPAIAIASLLPNANGAVALIVGMAGAVAVNALVAQSMLSANAWSLRGGEAAVGLIAALLWLVPADRSGETCHPGAGVQKRGAEWPR